MKQDKTFVTPRYLKIKDYFKSKTYDKEILNDWCVELLETLADLTMQGITKIEDISLDVWKMRVWVIIEKSGNLAPFRDNDDSDEEVGSNDDDWYIGDDSDIMAESDEFFNI